MWSRILACALLAIGWLFVCFVVLVGTGSDGTAAAVLVAGYSALAYWFWARAMKRIAVQLQPARRWRGLFFRKNASNREKVFTLTFYAWLALLLYGHSSSFVANGWWNWLAIGWALPIALYFFLPLLVDRHPANIVATFEGSKRSTYYLGQFMLCYVLAWSGVAQGFAAAATRLGGESAHSDFSVTWKSSGGRRINSCRHELEIVNRESNEERKVCVAEEVWEATAVGDVLHAMEKHSWFGRMIIGIGTKT